MISHVVHRPQTKPVRTTGLPATVNQIRLLFRSWLTMNGFTETDPTPIPAPAPDPGSSPTPVVFFQDEVIRLVNLYRSGGNVAPLKHNQDLDDLARTWAEKMAALGVIDHGDFSGRITAAFPNRYAAENIAFGYTTPAAAVAKWMSDPGHRDNIMNPIYAEAGLGMVGYFWCLDFIGNPI